MAPSTTLTPAQRTQRARLAAHARWAKAADRSEQTRAARLAFLDKFVDEVDPDRVLPLDERERRAESARKAYMARLAFNASKARSAKATAA